jgi:hypothetical protein
MLPQAIRRLLERAPPRPPIELFDEETGDAAYLAARNFPGWRDVREQLERAWRRVWRHCPEGPRRAVSSTRTSFLAVFGIVVVAALRGERGAAPRVGEARATGTD